MRKLRLIASALLVALGCLPAPQARAQGAVATEGALFLLVPVGARAIARGQAGVSLKLGAEGSWWNPAAVGWLTKRELVLDYAKLEFVEGYALDLVAYAGLAGVVSVSGLSFKLLGDQFATDRFGNVIGRILPSAMVGSVTYAAPFGDRVSAGVSYKKVQNGQKCSGTCGDAALYSVSTDAFDIGMQLVPDSARRLTIGAAIRNFGIGLQTIDAEQTDPLPARVHVGATYSFPTFLSSVPGTVLDVTAEFVSKPSFSHPEADLRFGAEVRFLDVVSFRGGLPTIKTNSETTQSGDGSKAVFGIGLRRGTLNFDIARAFGGTSSTGGQPPTYVSVRVVF